MTDGDREVIDAVDELTALVAADGARLDLAGWDESTGTLRLRLVLDEDDASCAECVAPRELLETIALGRVRRAHPSVSAVVVDDPRAPA